MEVATTIIVNIVFWALGAVVAAPAIWGIYILFIRYPYNLISQLIGRDTW